jgi:hypothetical protein
MKTRSFSGTLRPGVPATEAHSVPMIRLFDERDIEFLRAMPGYTRRMETEFRRRRCRIFRGYLRSLRAEFLVAETQLETLRIAYPEDRQQTAMMALSCRMRFNGAMIAAYLRLFQYRLFQYRLFEYRWGLGGADLGPVVRRFEDIRGEIRHWIPEIS